MRFLSLTLLVFSALVISGCSQIINSQLNNFADDLSDTIMNHEDPATIAAATPTLLVIVDSLASGNRASADMQLAAAEMYGAFSNAFIGDDPSRQKVLSRRGLDFAEKGSCNKHRRWCGVTRLSRDEFNDFVDSLGKKDVAVAYALASSWLGYIQAHSDDWGVVADLARAKTLLEFVVEYDETHDNAGGHLFLGAIATTLPPSMGGQPDVGKAHFERTLQLTEGRHLLAKVEYARRYARTMFDQELHNRLLNEVLEADIHEPGLTLMNAWAKQQAEKLLAEESDYFD